MTEEELRTIVDVSQENGVIEHEERDMIHNLLISVMQKPRRSWFRELT